MSSCSEDKMFQEELYKKVFALVSSDDYNVLTVEHDLREPESTGYISASCGGTNPTEKDIRVVLVQDIDLFNRYNRGNFDVETDKYANLLPPDKYDIDDYSLTIPAGERSGRMKIRIRPEGLSPDSTYLISLKVDNYSNYEVNPDKKDVLYRIMLKNYYAVQKTATNYTERGKLGEMNVLGTKRMFPLTYNSVRIIAGNEVFASDTATINSYSIILEIDARNKVTVKPFRHLYVEQVDGDPDYPNTFFIEDDGFRTYKTFLLRYNYKKANDNTLYEMREELRLEFREQS
jgi:hypothetical protein